MELEVAAVLRESQHDLPNDQELTESEKKSLLKLSLEEVSVPIREGSLYNTEMPLTKMVTTQGHLFNHGT